mgnify:CR=1 FL=1
MSLRRRGVQLRRQRVPSSIEWEYEPHERQKEFHRSGATFKLYGGAMGGGFSDFFFFIDTANDIENPTAFPRPVRLV